jgi:PAS domain S-box-containing protein
VDASRLPDSLADLDVGAEAFLVAVLQTAAQPVWVVDHVGLIRFANRAAVEALGYDRASELLGLPSHETIHYRHADGSPYPAADCPMLLPRATGEDVAGDLDWFCRRDGSMFPVSYVSVAIEMPEGRGAVVAFTDIEARVRAEQVLLERDAALAAQQASLRRVATLVAGGATSAEVFAAIAREVARVLDLPAVHVWRYEPDGTATVLGVWSDRPNPFQPGTRWPHDLLVTAAVREHRRPVRIDDITEVPTGISEAARSAGFRSGAGAPIIVDGEVWGLMGIGRYDDEPLPDRIEDRLVELTELVANGISTTTSREQVAQLAEEQSALRRVATLVARGVPASELFAAVAREVGLLLGVDITHMGRYEADGSAIGVASWSRTGDELTVGMRSPIDDENVSASIWRTGRPARMNSYDDPASPVTATLRELGIQSTVGAPIVVDQQVWGAMIAATKADRPLSPGTESRIAAFTELVATAISNSEARAEAARLTDEQAALRRVATLVARESPLAEIFAAVGEELKRLLGVHQLRLIRFEADATFTIVADWGVPELSIPVGTRLPWGGDNPSTSVLQTGRPARLDDFAQATGVVGDYARNLGVRSSVGYPIMVEERLWGCIVAASPLAEPLPAGTEARIGEFTALIATAISNLQARSELAASGARIAAAADEERRRVVRDLHDGAQQRLVHTIITLEMAREALQTGQERGIALVTQALDHAQQATTELRELAQGILPSVLTHGGLRDGVESLTSQMAVPVENGVAVGRLPAAVEATAYFVVAEALTNVAKHSGARSAAVTARVENGTLHVEVRDDGAGGARPGGSGLQGLADRVAVLDGRLQVGSPPDGGTLVTAAIPLPG